MSETKWTPGPWAVWSDDEVYAESSGEKLVVVPDSECGRDVYGADMVSRNECKHNARLIAAAPELYELAKEAHDLIEGDLVGAEWKKACHQLVAKSKAVMAKARGE